MPKNLSIYATEGYLGLRGPLVVPMVGQPVRKNFSSHLSPPSPFSSSPPSVPSPLATPFALVSPFVTQDVVVVVVDFVIIDVVVVVQ